MDSEAQADGEKRVRRALIETLDRRGLMKPGGMTTGQFEAMRDDLARRLAYMSSESLAALEEVAAAHPGGKERDRFPIANDILKWAAEIEAPRDDGSPLMRRVFSLPMGQDAIAEGWAPELLAHLRKYHKFPSAFLASQIRGGAGDAVRRMTVLEERMARGETLSPEDVAFRQRRLTATEKCRRIAALAQGVDA
ncbi:hypothetical protein DDZ14_08450 [Maritimibacter sp. 55A14]|uniref:hypothetical protein n=1 Tax=Maritimibacter sp. 55A14 TaxID=2174844 RepID=UPI000D6060CA|nr:hypothetical protein [Maritimibacter sp. 55A14]PWE32767.1 hypothetical protein DDZ14_08450 [Maritimibacter sp. 55A14]